MSPYIPCFYQCPQCHFISREQKYWLDKESEKAHYAHHENSIDNLGYVQMFEHFLEFVNTQTEYEKVLDFGVGPGPVLAKKLEKSNKHILCYDPYFFPNKDYLEQKYNLITSTEVFEHIANPLETLIHLKELLEPNGTIAIMTHFHPNESFRFESWWYHKDPTHISFYTPNTFEILAREASLHVKACDGVKYILLNP